MKDITNKIATNNLQSIILQHELPEADLTQGRGTPDKSFIFKSVSIQYISISLFSLNYNKNFTLYNFVTDNSIIGPFEPQT